MTIDAHTHLFSLDTARYPLANPDSDYQPVLEGSATLLKQRLDEAGIDIGRLLLLPGSTVGTIATRWIN